MEDAFRISKANSMGADKGKSSVTTMATATMTPPSATLLNLARSMFSQRTVLQSNRGSHRTVS
eukprot:1559091-Ditylum_brightwellii.AAC.1